MSESKANQCEFHLIKAWMPVSKPYLKASVKSITDFKFKDLDKYWIIETLTQIEGSRYLATIYNTCTYISSVVELDTKSSNYKLICHASSPSLGLTVNDITLVFQFNEPVLVVQASKVIYRMGILCRSRYCKNYSTIAGRWCQETGDSVYVIDHEDYLYRIVWLDIIDGNYAKKELIDSNVEDFWVIKGSFGMIHKDGVLKLPFGKILDLKSVESNAQWTIITEAAKHWIVSGDLDGQAIIASIKSSGKVKSTLTIHLTSIGIRVTIERTHATMYTLKTVTVVRHKSIVMAFERDSICHLISVNTSGKMMMINTIADVLPAKLAKLKKIIKYAIVLDGKGNVLVGGVSWTKKISLKFK